MTDTTPSELQRLIAAEFDRRRWEYGLDVGPKLVAEIERSGDVNANKLVRVLPPEFFHRNQTNRDIVAGAIERAVSGRTPKREAAGATLVFEDNRRYELKIGKRAHVTNSPINVGSGTQLNVSVDASKRELLGAVEAVIRAGIAGDWNADAARELADVIDGRADIDYDDVRQITAEVAKAEQPKQGRVKKFLTDIAVGGLGGALGTGISAGLGEVIHQLPM